MPVWWDASPTSLDQANQPCSSLLFKPWGGSSINSFLPHNNQTRILYFLTKKEKYKEKGSKFSMKGVNFWKKIVDDQKKSSEIFENRRIFFNFFLRMLSENIFSQNYPNLCPPIFMTSLRHWLSHAIKVVISPYKLALLLTASRDKAFLVKSI